jgi:O-antigen/teichoic acid export membrane protein
MIAIARLLTPAEIGEWALGVTLVMLLTFVGGGQALTGAMIRKPEEPTRDDLRALLGFELLVTALLSAAAAALALALAQTVLHGDKREVALLTAVMLLPLSLDAWRTPAYITSERALLYRPIALAETFETIAYYAWAIASVGAGMGAWGLATGAVVRTLVGVSVVLALTPERILMPSLRWRRVRPLVRMGLQIGMTELTEAAGNQGLSLGTAGIAGTPVLGLWTIARRPLQIPTLLYDSLLRVSFPAMSKIVAAGEDARPVIERAIRFGAVASALLLTPIAVGSPGLVGAVFGPQWNGVASVLPPACLGLAISVPISLGLTGYLWAIGDGRTPLLAALGNTAAWLGVGFALLPRLGAPALGIGLMVGSLTSALILRRGALRHVRARVYRLVLLPVGLALLCGSGGWLFTRSHGNSVGSALVAAAAVDIAYLALLALVQRRLFGEARLLLASARGVRAEATTA